MPHFFTGVILKVTFHLFFKSINSDVQATIVLGKSPCSWYSNKERGYLIVLVFTCAFHKKISSDSAKSKLAKCAYHRTADMTCIPCRKHLPPRPYSAVFTLHLAGWQADSLASGVCCPPWECAHWLQGTRKATEGTPNEPYVNGPPLISVQMHHTWRSGKGGREGRRGIRGRQGGCCVRGQGVAGEN